MNHHAAHDFEPQPERERALRLVEQRHPAPGKSRWLAMGILLAAAIAIVILALESENSSSRSNAKRSAAATTATNLLDAQRDESGRLQSRLASPAAIKASLQHLRMLELEQLAADRAALKVLENEAGSDTAITRTREAIASGEERVALIDEQLTPPN